MTEADRAQLARIEAKLDTLIAALAEDEETEPEATDLDGNAALGRERASGQTLD